MKKENRIWLQAAFSIAGFLVFLLSGTSVNATSLPGVEWVKTLSTSTTDSGRVSAMDSVGNIIIAGYEYNPGFENADPFFTPQSHIAIKKYTPTGNLVWSKVFSSGWTAFTPEDITVDSSDRIYVTGSFYGSLTGEGVSLTGLGANPDGYALVFSADGNLLLSKALISWGSVYPSAIAATASGTFYIAGSFVGFQPLQTDAGDIPGVQGLNGFIVKVDPPVGFASGQTVTTPFDSMNSDTMTNMATVADMVIANNQLTTIGFFSKKVTFTSTKTTLVGTGKLSSFFAAYSLDLSDPVTKKPFLWATNGPEASNAAVAFIEHAELVIGQNQTFRASLGFSEKFGDKYSTYITFLSLDKNGKTIWEKKSSLATSLDVTSIQTDSQGTLFAYGYSEKPFSFGGTTIGPLNTLNTSTVFGWLVSIDQSANTIAQQAVLTPKNPNAAVLPGRALLNSDNDIFLTAHSTDTTQINDFSFTPLNKYSLILIKLGDMPPLCGSGDLNCDGVVNVLDVQCEILMVQWELDGGKGPFPACFKAGTPDKADMNGDATINVTDIILVVNKTLDVAEEKVRGLR